MIENTANNETAQTANNEIAQTANNETAQTGIAMTQAQADLERLLNSVMKSINETLISADKNAFRFAFDIKRCYDLIDTYRNGTKDPFYFDGRKYSKVEQFAKEVFGLSKSAFLSKVKIANEFCNAKGLPDPEKTRGLKYSSLQDITASEVLALEQKYNAIPVKEGKKKPAFSDLSIKSIRALKNAANVLITEGGIVDAAKALPDESKSSKAEKESRNLDNEKGETSETNAKEKAINSFKAYVTACTSEDELKAFLIELIDIKAQGKDLKEFILDAMAVEIQE